MNKPLIPSHIPVGYGRPPGQAQLEALASLYQEGKIDFDTAQQLSGQPNSTVVTDHLLAAESARNAATASKLIDRPARKRPRAGRFSAKAPHPAPSKPATAPRDTAKKIDRDRNGDVILVRPDAEIAYGPYAGPLKMIDRLVATPFGVDRRADFTVRPEAMGLDVIGEGDDTWETQGADDESRTARETRQARRETDRSDEVPSHRYLKTGSVRSTPKDDERPIDYRPTRAVPPEPSTTPRRSLREEIASRIPFDAPPPQPVRYDDIAATAIAAAPLGVTPESVEPSLRRTTAAVRSAPEAGLGPRSNAYDRFHRIPAL
ncbi:MAG: hypothetical protein HY696_04505 [Deltaproteobacteria bacterium]|nr:hypothetical protein [Deltaproteobacteria bacterium]